MKKSIEILAGILLAVIAVGAWGLIALYVYWPADIECKIGLLRSLLVASTVLMGFISIFLFKIVIDGERFAREKGISENKMKNLRIFLSWSIITGFLAILTIMFYFISYELLLIPLAWVLFILQLQLFVLPLLFARIIAFR